MASLLVIKKQIKGIKNTRKITKAMQLVAASKSKGFQVKAHSIRSFAMELLYILNHNEQNIDESRFSKSPREAEDVLFVLYSSDKGLCGALNNQLSKVLLNSKVWLETPEEKRKLITIGRKAAAFAKYSNIPTLKNIEGISEKLTAYESLEHVEEILKEWDSKNYKKVYMVAPHYKNTFTTYPIMKQFLPISAETLKAHIGVDPQSYKKEVKKHVNTFMLYEPEKTIVTKRLVEDLIHTLFLQAFYELKAAEYSFRMMAMQNATDSADKLISEKSLIYNKARQSAITQEIAEIVGASFI